MEAELHVRLYEKLGRRLELTPAARVLTPYFVDSLAQFEAALSVLQEWKSLKQGAVRIGAGPTLRTYVLPALSKRYGSRYPDVELLVETGNTRYLLDTGPRRLGPGLDRRFRIARGIQSDGRDVVEH